MPKPPKPPLTRSEAKSQVAIAVHAMSRVNDGRKPSAAIPRGVMSAGELDILLQNYVTLLGFVHPGIADEEQVLVLASAPTGTEH